MPIRKRRILPPSPEVEQLRKRLAQEFAHPQELEPEPIIIEENGSPYRPIHLYVIWSQWADLNQQERSELIMDAYEDAHGKDKALQVTVAMGLTAREAQRMGIEYE